MIDFDKNLINKRFYFQKSTDTIAQFPLLVKGPKVAKSFSYKRKYGMLEEVLIRLLL